MGGMKLRVLAAALATWSAIAAPALSQALQGAALARALQRGGYVLVVRHAHAPAQPPVGAAIDPANTAGERQLDQAGRASARSMGDAIARLHIRVGEVWSSPTYRAKETVKLAGLPSPRLAPELGDQGRSMITAASDQGAWLKAKVAQPPARQSDTVIVTQSPNIVAAFGPAAADLQEGGALVFFPISGHPPELVGRIASDDWLKLAPVR